MATGFQRSGKMTICVGDDHVDTDFNVFCPKVLAGIGHLWDTVMSRSIPIRLERAARDELAKIEKLHAGRARDALAPFRQRLTRWALDHLAGLKDEVRIDPPVPEALGARQADIWRPLLAIADEIGGEWTDRARYAAVGLHRGGDDEHDWGLLLLSDVRDAFTQHGAPVLSSQALAEYLARLEHRPWPEANNGKAITTRGIAKLLGRFGVKSKSVRVGDATPKGYAYADLLPAFRRYLPALDGCGGDEAQQPRSRNESNPNAHSDVADVADSAEMKGARDRVSREDPGYTLLDLEAEMDERLGMKLP